MFQLLLNIFALLHLSFSNDLIVRQKRQYYICGTYPNQFYSLYPCDVWNNTPQPNDPNRCSNGGRKIGVGCYFNYQCSAYSNGATTECINNCCCTVPVRPTTLAPTTPSIANLAYCYNGQRSQVRCATSVDCASGQTCVNGICCTTTGNEWQGSCGGLPAISACQTGQTNPCGQFVCTSSNYCCECQYGRTAGICSNGCPTGYTCNSNGYCCASCPSGRSPYGSCFNGLCANGYTCQAGNICC